MSDSIKNSIGKSKKKVKEKTYTSKFQRPFPKRMRNNLEDLPTKEPIRSYIDYRDYGYKYVKKFFAARVGQNIDKVYSEFKEIQNNNQWLLNNIKIRKDQFTQEWMIHWGFIIDENKILQREKLFYRKQEYRRLQKENPYKTYLNSFMSRLFPKLTINNYTKDKCYSLHSGDPKYSFISKKNLKSNIILVKDKDKEYVYDKDKNSWYQSLWEKKQFNDLYFKLRSLNKKEVKSLNLNAILKYEGQCFDISNKKLE